jgi:hypothetical protein
VEFLRRYVGNGEDEASNKKKKDKAWERAIKDATQTYHLLGTLEVEGVQLVWLAKSDEQPTITTTLRRVVVLNCRLSPLATKTKMSPIVAKYRQCRRYQEMPVPQAFPDRRWRQFQKCRQLSLSRIGNGDMATTTRKNKLSPIVASQRRAPRMDVRERGDQQR